MDCQTEVGKERKNNTFRGKNLCHNWEMNPYVGKGRKNNTYRGKNLCHDWETRRSVEHCTPHADGAWLNELGWSQ